MSVGEEEEIFVMAFHGERQFVAQDVEIQGHHKISASKGSAGVATLTLMHHADDIASHLARNFFQFLDIRHVGGWFKNVN